MRTSHALIHSADTYNQRRIYLAPNS